jgi:hypothetical protein
MATLQRIAISLLLTLTFAFFFLAQGTQAKGPKITDHVCLENAAIGTWLLVLLLTTLLGLL